MPVIYNVLIAYIHWGTLIFYEHIDDRNVWNLLSLFTRAIGTLQVLIPHCVNGLLYSQEKLTENRKLELLSSFMWSYVPGLAHTPCKGAYYSLDSCKGCDDLDPNALYLWERNPDYLRAVQYIATLIANAQCGYHDRFRCIEIVNLFYWFFGVILHVILFVCVSLVSFKVAQM